MRNSGFTLIEMLIGMAILAVLIIAAIMALSPQLLVGKASDAKRKSDLNKIRTAFEEYYNDKGYYPSQGNLNSWNISDNCEKEVPDMSKYIKKWPCDSQGNIYTIVSTTTWFKVITNLENKQDKDIPDGWYGSKADDLYPDVDNKESINYGVSSLNILWYEGEEYSFLPAYCDYGNGECYDKNKIQLGYGEICTSPPGEKDCYVGFPNEDCRVNYCESTLVN